MVDRIIITNRVILLSKWSLLVTAMNVYMQMSGQMVELVVNDGGMCNKCGFAKALENKKLSFPIP